MKRSASLLAGHSGASPRRSQSASAPVPVHSTAVVSAVAVFVSMALAFQSLVPPSLSRPLFLKAFPLLLPEHPIGWDPINDQRERSGQPHLGVACAMEQRECPRRRP